MDDAFSLLKHKGFQPDDYYEEVKAAADGAGIIDVGEVLDKGERNVLRKVLSDGKERKLPMKACSNPD